MQAGASSSVCPRAKPYVYKTDDGKVIVEDELLNFIAIKMRTLAQDEVVLIASSNFPSEWIEESKRLLFELCKTTVRNIKHKGPQKDTNNVKDCMKVLNECGEHTPRFVSHFLDQLPPVGFGSFDASALLSRLTQLSWEVTKMRVAMDAQTGINESLGITTAAMDRRLTDIEKLRDLPGQNHGADQTSAGAEQSRGTSERARGVGRCVTAPERSRGSTEWARGAGGGASAAVEQSHGSGGRVQQPGGSAAAAAVQSHGSSERAGAGEDVGELAVSAPQYAAATSPRSQLLSPQWSDVVKKSRKKSGPPQAAGAPKLHKKQAHVKRDQRNVGIVGTGSESGIGVVKTKLVNVFATRFSPTLEVDALRVYLSEKLKNNTVTCRKIESAQGSRYSSFHITSECDNVADMYDPKLWPAGIYVRVPKGSGSEGVNELICHDTPVAPHESQPAM